MACQRLYHIISCPLALAAVRAMREVRSSVITCSLWKRNQSIESNSIRPDEVGLERKAELSRLPSSVRFYSSKPTLLHRNSPSHTTNDLLRSCHHLISAEVCGVESSFLNKGSVLTLSIHHSEKTASEPTFSLQKQVNCSVLPTVVSLSFPLLCRHRLARTPPVFTTPDSSSRIYLPPYRYLHH